MVSIDDIAHHLSHICRFNGATRVFYSVAEHSVHVSHLVDPALAFVGLMHDATEAYCGDLIRPVKHMLPEYMRMEHGIWGAVAERFGLPASIPIEVKAADNIALLTERREFINGWEKMGRWNLVDEGVIQPDSSRIYALENPAAARLKFLNRFDELMAIKKQEVA